MLLVMNVHCQHSLPIYIPEWKGVLSFKRLRFKKETIILILRLAYNIHCPSTPFAFHFILCAYS